MKQRCCTPAANQRGVTLIEVLIAMLLSLIGATAMISLAGNAYTANAQAQRAFAAASTSRSLLATIEGSPQILGSINGVGFGTANGSSAPAVLQDWWAAQKSKFPDLQGLSISTQPNPCSPTAPCQIIATLTLRSAFGSGSMQRTFVLQDGF